MCVGVCTCMCTQCECVWVNDGVYNMCVCVHVCSIVCARCVHMLCVFACVCICVCLCVCMSKCVSVCVVCTLCAHMHTRVHVCMYMHVNVSAHGAYMCMCFARECVTCFFHSRGSQIVYSVWAIWTDYRLELDVSC